MARAKNPICPMCKKREKAPGRHYCRLCENAKLRAYQLGGDREKICPLCGAKFVSPHRTYCPTCSALNSNVRSKRLKKKCEEKKHRYDTGVMFAKLKAEAEAINWRYAFGCGIVSKQQEEAPPEKRELTLSDFVGRDDEPSLFQHL